MHDRTDMELLRHYARQNSNAAFDVLVSRHVNLVYSVALRKTGNPHAAEEITQAVFVILAQKAGRIPDQTILPGWLYQAARLTAASFVRRELRRARREQKAFMLSQSDPPSDLSRRSETTADETWEQLAPLLEDAMGQLGDKDRAAVVLRFFGGKSFAEVGAADDVSENAAKKRVSHALEKLRRYFSKRGVNSTTAVIAGTISANSVQTAPVTLTKSVTAVAVAKGTAASGSTLTLIKGALKIMAWTNAKTAIVIGAGVALVAGITTVKEIYHYRMYSWEVPHPDLKTLQRASRQVAIVPAKFPATGGGWVVQNGKGLGISVGVNDLLEFAYTTDARMVFNTELPRERYDFIANLPQGSAPALQTEIEKKLGLVGRLEPVETNVLVLRVKNPNAPGLRPNRTGGANNNPQFGEYSCANQPISSLAYFLELYLGTPVIDRTGLTGLFDMDVKWDDKDRQHRNADGLKQALLDQAGLELVPARETIEMLVVDKVK